MRSVELLALYQMFYLRKLSNYRSVLLVLLHLRVLEVLNQIRQTLQTCISNIAYLFTFKTCPSLPLKMLIEHCQVVRRQEIDETITHVALIFNIARQIQKVISVGKYQIDFVCQVDDCVLVRYIPNHDSCARVRSDVLLTDFETFVLTHPAPIEVILHVCVIEVVVIGVHVHSTRVALLRSFID